MVTIRKQLSLEEQQADLTIKEQAQKLNTQDGKEGTFTDPILKANPKEHPGDLNAIMPKPNTEENVIISADKNDVDELDRCVRTMCFHIMT